MITRQITRLLLLRQFSEVKFKNQIPWVYIGIKRCGWPPWGLRVVEEPLNNICTGINKNPIQCPTRAIQCQSVISLCTNGTRQISAWGTVRIKILWILRLNGHCKKTQQKRSTFFMRFFNISGIVATEKESCRIYIHAVRLIKLKQKIRVFIKILGLGPRS